MKSEYVNSFYKATGDVFNLMLDLEPKRSNLNVCDGLITSRDASVLLGVSGSLEGSVLFSFSEKMAYEMIHIMSGIEMDKLDSFVTSALGEIANIIGGNALTYLANEGYKCDIAPPEFVLGQNKSVQTCDSKALILTMTTSIGDFDIIIFLVENNI